MASVSTKIPLVHLTDGRAAAAHAAHIGGKRGGEGRKGVGEGATRGEEEGRLGAAGGEKEKGNEGCVCHLVLFRNGQA